MASGTICKSGGHLGFTRCPNGPNMGGFQMFLGFRQHRPTFKRLTSNSINRNLKSWASFRLESRWESYGKAFFVGRVGIAIKASVRESRAVGRLGLVCIGSLVVLDHEVAVLGGTLFNGLHSMVQCFWCLPGSSKWRCGMSPFSSLFPSHSEADEVWGDVKCSCLLSGRESGGDGRI